MNKVEGSKYLIGAYAEKCACDELFDVLACAEEIVDCAILNAVNELEKCYDCDVNNDCPGCETKSQPEDPESDWPTSQKMSVRDGLRCVKRMMKEWKAERAMGGWKFYAEFIGLESDGHSDFYSYQVRWSVPTAPYPEPQVTVSVFFTVEAARGDKNQNSPVNVTYVFEGNQFAHSPKMRFRPKWIYDVLDTKTMIFKSLKF